MSRNDVFLREMGIGVQWRLRNVPPAPDAVDDGAPDAEIIAAAATATAAAANQAASPAMAATAAATGAGTAVDSAAGRPAAASAPAPLQSVPAAQLAAGQPAARANAPARDALPVQAPASDAAQRAAPAPAPSAAAPSGDDSAWFDEAPVLAPVSAARAAVAEPGDSSPAGKVSAQAIANMDWPALQAAVASCTRCDLCLTRKAAVPGRGDPHAQWLALGTAPSAEDEQSATAFAGEPGQLLDNMLKAVGLAPEEDAYATTLVKCRPPQDGDGVARQPGADELAACRPYLERELELAGTRIILALGHTTGKGLVGAAARGKVLRCDGIPVVATYHPADLLRKPADKARAWADLCLAKAAHAGRA